MQRYESYKPSEAAWLGNVPSHWDIQPLRAVTSLKSDKNRPDLPVLSVYREYGVILKDSRDDNHNATSLDTSTYKVVKPGDLVVNKMKAWQGSMGVSAYDGIVSPAYITCTTKADRVRPAYLHYLLRSSPLIGVYSSLSYGVRVGQWDMHYEDFKQIPIPLPPKDEQDRIVAFLDQKTAEIDATIAKKERLIELLNEQKSILLNTALTRGLKSDQSFKESDSPWLGSIPKNWAMVPLAGFMSFISYGFTNPMPTEDDGPYMLTSNDIGDGSIRLDTARRTSKKAFDWKLTGKSKPHRGDILVTKDGTLGRTALVETDEPICISQSVALLRPRKDTNPEFLTAALRSDCYLRKMIFDAGGTTIKHIYITRLGKMRIATPPPEEQLQIVNHCKELEKHFHALVSAENRNITAMRELRAALISAVVTGNVKV